MDAYAYVAYDRVVTSCVCGKISRSPLPTEASVRDIEVAQNPMVKWACSFCGAENDVSIVVGAELMDDDD